MMLPDKGNAKAAKPAKRKSSFARFAGFAFNVVTR
jgi:hypothetical protein